MVENTYECPWGCEPSSQCWGCNCTLKEICRKCGDDLDEVTDAVAAHDDMLGLESLTEQEQAFLEGYQLGVCPNCMI